MNQNNSVYNPFRQENQVQINGKLRKKQIRLMIIGVAILVIGLIGITYAFFNYTRTGSSNVIKTGRIVFNSEQTGNAINLTNVFPIDVTNGIPNDNTQVGIITIDITGDTTYDNGVEYLVTATNVSDSVGSKIVPISIDVTYAASENKDIGTVSNNYFSVRGGNTSYYKVLSGNTISNGDRLLVGYIAKGNTGIDGTITIKAYLDKAKIAISDTYAAENTDTNSDGYIDGTPTSFGEGKVVFTTEEWNGLQINGVSFQIKVEANEGIWVKDQIRFDANGGTVTPAYKEIEDDATTYGALPTPIWAAHNFDGWYTEANGGTKVEASTTYTKGTSATTLYAHWEEVPTIASCPGCQFLMARDLDEYSYGENGTLVTDITDTISYDYREIMEEPYIFFIGFTEKNGRVDRAYSCGIIVGENNEETPFCVEGTADETRRDDVISANHQLSNNVFGDYDSQTDYGCRIAPYSQDIYYCYGLSPLNDGHVYANINNNGSVDVGLDGDSGWCEVMNTSKFHCW